MSLLAVCDTDRWRDGGQTDPSTGTETTRTKGQGRDPHLRRPETWNRQENLIRKRRPGRAQKIEQEGRVRNEGGRSPRRPDRTGQTALDRGGERLDYKEEVAKYGEGLPSPHPD